MTSFRQSLLWLALQSGLLVAAHDGLSLKRGYLNVSSSSTISSTSSSLPLLDLLASSLSSTTSTSLILSRSHSTTLTTSTSSQRGRVLTEVTTSEISSTSNIGSTLSSIVPASENTPSSNVGSTIPSTASPVSPPFISSNPSASVGTPPIATAPTATGRGGLSNSSSLVSPTRAPYGNSTTSIVSVFVTPPVTTDSCTSLSLGQAMTSWLILPNTTTVTLTVTANWTTTFTTTPEFTPPTYCPQPYTPFTYPAYTATEKTTAAESSYTLSAAAPTVRPTTTVITTSKNPVTVFTTASIPVYGGNTDKESASPSTYIDTYIWSPLPQPTFVGTDTGETNTDPGASNGFSSVAPNTGNPSAPYTTVYNGDGSNPGPITETVGGVTVVVSSTKAVIGGQTVSIGGGDKTVTEGGDVFTVNPSQVIGPSIIVNVPTNAGGQFLQTPTPTTVQGVSIDINPSTVVIAGTSYQIGVGAPQETIVAKGQTITIGSAGVIFSATTIAPPGGQPTNVVIVDGQVFSAVGSDTAVIGGKTFTYSPGIAPQTDIFNGETITIGPQGVSFDGTTLGGIAHPTGTQLGIAGGLSVTEIGSTLAIVGGHTLTFGPGASTTTTVINGQTITAGPTGLSIGGATLTAPFNVPTQEITAGGITFSEIGSTLAVIGGKTFTFGPGATKTTDVFDGQTISIGPSGIGFATTTFTGATSNPTATQSHTKNGAERLTFGGGVLGMDQSDLETPIPSLDFMQSEPIQTSEHILNPINTSEASTTPQYGIFSNNLHSADLDGSLNENRSRSAGAGHMSDGTESPSDEDAILQDQLRRLSVNNSSLNKPKASFQRIAEYENALSPSLSKRRNEGPGFKIIKKKGDGIESIQLEKFPNEVLTHILSHLPAASLSAVSLVSRRFYTLVTTPHAWRIAFSRFFPGEDSVDELRQGNDLESREQLRSETRLFTRLTGLASWRSEYILRTRLLRSLGRGKPAQSYSGHGSSRSSNAANNANPVVTYNSQLFATINHIHASWNSGKKPTRFIHGTDETGSACTSDPNIGKIDNWGLSDPQNLAQFSELFVGHQPYGMDDGPAGLPNSMDVSQPFGMIYGEGFPAGQIYFRSSEEMRGRFLSQPTDLVHHGLGIPRIPELVDAIASVWIAKSLVIPTMTDGLIGMLVGSTLGVVTAFSLGSDTALGRRISKGQSTARWVLSPGVPIIAIKVDDSYNAKRKASGRVWAVALNALGEVFYLTDTITSTLIDGKLEDNEIGKYAWKAGRTAYWQLVEPSRRVARDDPYHEFEVHGSYSPRSSSKKMKLSKAQLAAETAEIEKFLKYRPAHFRKICEGWDMRRKLEVDFAGDDGNSAGEIIVVVKCGMTEGEPAEVKRFTRWKSEQASLDEYPLPKTPPMASKMTTMASLFGGSTVISPPRNASPEPSKRTSIFGGSSTVTPVRASSPDQSTPSTPTSPGSRITSLGLVEEWRTTILTLKNHPKVEITTTAIDTSTYATLTVDEDPLRTVNGGSNFSSPMATPSDQGTGSSANIPGHRARFLAIGTKNGSVIMWNMRGPQSTNPSITNELHPLRTIYTDSPQISCLAVSALYVIHGGNDGLVQTWDPLASTLQPIRTLNSRFSSRARRRLVQAEASIYGVGINLYAAGAICIDPDPTILRGMVSLGTHLRYWSYSSSAADQYQSKKRRLRRSGERGSNSGPDRFTNTGRGALMDYIATEQEELKKEKLRRSREDARLQARFGVGLGGLTEEEQLKYAELMSAEAFQQDEERRKSDADLNMPVWDSSPTVTPERRPSPKFKTDDEFDHDIEEAIRLSLLDGVDEGGRSPRASGSGDYAVKIKPKKEKGRRSGSSSPSTSLASKNRKGLGVGFGSGSKGKGKEFVAADDLELALQLSLAEERSRRERVGESDFLDESDILSDEMVDEFPALEAKEVAGKGKGRAI